MRFDAKTVQAAERRAFDMLVTPPAGMEKFKVKGSQITSPGKLVQELQLTNANNNYVFEFGQNAPVNSAQLNNITLGQNNVAAVYGLQVLLGYGANGNTRQYATSGININDNVIYNGIGQMNIESSTPVDKVDLRDFQTTFFQGATVMETYAGLILINPIRFVSGQVSKFQFQMNLQSIAGVPVSANCFISVRLWCVVGLA